jgi:hypothetical protein
MADRETTTWTCGEVTPVVAGFYPDPTICRVGDEYYLAHSSFEYFPGAPIFRSTDLVTWTQIGNIMSRRSQFVRGEGRSSTGIYGSTLRHHGGRFWFITTNVSDYDAGQVLVHAVDPAGPWSEPVFVPEAIGIDPDLCWDEDDRCYLTWHALDLETGEQSIRQAPLDLARGVLLAPAYDVWQGSGLPAAEGPHLYHRGQWWYLLLAEGGTERGHCVTVARARRPDGPFEACPDNPVLTRRSTIHPVQNVGHADLVPAPDGRWAAVYLGVRPRGSTPGFHVLGRETFLAGVDWVDGWPVLDTARFSVPARDHSFCDQFRGGALHPRWVVPGGQADDLRDAGVPDGLVLRATDQADALLCFRPTDLTWVAEADLTGSGRLVVRLDHRHAYEVVVDGTSAVALARVGGLRQEIGRTPLVDGPVTLRIRASDPGSPTVPRGDAGPDELVLSVLDGRGWHHLARLDGRYLSTEVASGFTGRVVGLGAGSRPAHVRAVRYTAPG